MLWVYLIVLGLVLFPLFLIATAAALVWLVRALAGAIWDLTYRGKHRR